MKARRARLLEHAKQAGCTAVAAFEPENIFYLTGFWGEAIAVTSEEGTKLIAPRLEFSRAESASTECEVMPTERGSELISTFATAVQGMSVCTDCSDYSTVESVTKHGANVVVNTEPFFQARRVKDEKELATIARASRILDKLYGICTEEIRP